MKLRQLMIFSLIVYVLSAGLVYAIKPQSNKVLGTLPSDAANGEQSVDDQTALGLLLQIDPQEPKDAACPLNGKLYTKTEEQAWQKRRPLAVMIENSPDARPQSGMSSADIVFEALAEGGVTRFMGMYYCDVQKQETYLAPVRSARTYFVDWASGFNRPLYVHVGGANLPGPADALGQISDYGWALENDLNQFSIGFPTFVRNNNRLDHEVATEHTMETTTEKLWAVGEKRGWTNMSPEMKRGKKVLPAEDWLLGFKTFEFADEPAQSGAVSNIAYDFWSGYTQYSVKWQYDSATKQYQRILADQPHMDLNNNKQITAKTVVVLLTDEKGPIDELKHMLYKTIGTGDALIFSNGEVNKVSWSKQSREAELKFMTKTGKAFAFSRGQIWISVLDKANEVIY